MEGLQKDIRVMSYYQRHQDFTQCQLLDQRYSFVSEMACIAGRHTFVLEAKDSKLCTKKSHLYLGHRFDFGSKK